MKRNQAQPGEWGRLFEAALRIKQMAPWDWMDETHIFGVQDPASGEIGFVSVMGALGEHIAVSVYQGSAALVRFMHLQETPEEVIQEYPEMLLDIPQLQASFEDRDALDDWDRQLIRNLGLKFRGRNAWPKFQSFRPGHMPWRLEPDEARVLALTLEQLAQVAPRARTDRSLLDCDRPGAFFVRTRSPAGEEAEVWQDRIVQVPPPELPPIPLAWDPQDVKRLKRVPAGKDTIEADFFLVPAVIGKKSERPACAYALLVLHSQSNMILGAEIIQIQDTLEQMWGRIPGLLLSRLANEGMRPREIRVQQRLLQNVLPPVFKELGTKVALKPFLKKLQAAKNEMLAFMEKGPPPF
jgi:hypothetical protein